MPRNLRLFRLLRKLFWRHETITITRKHEKPNPADGPVIDEFFGIEEQWGPGTHIVEDNTRIVRN